MRGWPKDIRSNVAERLEEAFGPLYEGTDTWKIPLSRDARSNRSGRKSEIYKLAIALGLTWQEIDTLFLLYRQGYNPHDPLDVAFYILYHYSASHNRELAWKDIMEVLTLYQLSLRGYDPTNPTDPKNPVVQALKRCRKEKGHSLSWAEQLEVLPLFPLTSAQGGGPGTGSANTGTAVLQRMTKDLSASNAGSSGDDAFKAGLAAQMAKNAAYFDSFTISTDAVPAPEPETKSKVKTVSDVSKHKMRGQVESSARYGRSRTAAPVWEFTSYFFSATASRTRATMFSAHRPKTFSSSTAGPDLPKVSFTPTRITGTGTVSQTTSATALPRPP